MQPVNSNRPRSVLEFIFIDYEFECLPKFTNKLAKKYSSLPHKAVNIRTSRRLASSSVDIHEPYTMQATIAKIYEIHFTKASSSKLISGNGP